MALVLTSGNHQLNNHITSLLLTVDERSSEKSKFRPRLLNDAVFVLKPNEDALFERSFFPAWSSFRTLRTKTEKLLHIERLVLNFSFMDYRFVAMSRSLFVGYFCES